MPDLQNYSVIRQAGTVTINNAPQWRIEFQITDSVTGAVIRDFTGANGFNFPQILGQLSQVDQDDLVYRWTMDIIRKRAADIFPGA